jgi:hypothetical protein
VSVLTNDACNNGAGCTLSNPNIVDPPNNGTVTVNPNGTVTYTPNTGFVGIDTLYYSTCDNQQPPQCDTAGVFITVIPTGSANVTAANDDFETGIIGVPVTGNALTNDTDPEGHVQTATTQNVTNANGTFVLNANGTFTFTPAQGFTGPVSYPYTVCDNGTPTACDTATIYILIEPILETDPDMNATLVNVSVPGNVNTNDDVPAGTTYGTPNPIAGNPPGGVIVMNPNGTYTFISPNIGEYNYLVPVCAPGVTGSNCLLELLTITVTEPYVYTEPPTANPDIATTLQNTPVTVSVLTNDACNNGAGCTLSNPNIVDPPNNGTVTVNANGTVTYTPNTGFVGIDTLYYSTCDNQQPPQCDTAGVFITVIPTGSANVTAANDDFETGIIGVPVTGNALTNDTDPEGHVQTATTQTVTNANGTFVLNANGTFTFTPAPGFTGPVSYPYTVCDNGTPTACDTATIYILIEPIIETDPDMNATLVNVSVPGNVNTNDDVPAGTTYGTPNPIAGNPPGGVIVMNPNGTYTFISPNIGEYNYLVPVCAPGVTGSNCLLELLTITVTEPYVYTEPPTANPDIATTLQNTPVTVSVLTNDACNNGAGCTLSNPNIVDPPNNGTVTVNANGTVTYTPNTGFVGIDTLYYSTCDNQQPPQCDTAGVFITVIPTGSANVTAANDDFETGIIGVPVTGNALTNDTDPEGHVQTATTQNVTNANGTFVLNANGTFTFTPAPGFTGPVSYPYTVCDNGTPTACDTATIYILIEPILEISGNVFEDNDGPTNINGTGTGTAGGTQLYANLASSTGLVIAIVPVNPNGSFVFTNVTSNTNYSVVITTTVGTIGSPVPVTTLPSGWTHVGEDCCDNIGNDGTPNGITTVVIGTSTVSNVNFGITQLVSVGNQVWNDSNRNGIKDASEAGLVGATVHVYADANSDGTPDGAALQTTTTGADGLYIFNGLVSGNYVIGVVPPGGPNAFTSSIVGQELNPNNNIDNNDNGIVTIGNETRSGTIVLSAGTEPIGELPNNTTTVDANANLTIDFGFFACPGTFTFAPQYVCSGNTVNLSTLEPAGFTGGVWSQGGTTLSSTNVGVGSYTYTFQEGTCVSVGTVVVEANIPDYTPTLAIAPSAITGISNVRVIATITELLNRPSCSDVYVFVPRLEPRFTFTYEPTATLIGGVAVNNSAWQFFNTNPNFYVWKYVGGATFPAAGSIKFGYLGSYDPNQTDGVTTFSAQVFQGSGGEINLSNNTDSEVLLYFR